MSRRFFCLLATLAFAPPLCAQEPKLSPLPEGPLLKRAPDFSTWTISIQGTPTGGAASEATDAAGGTPFPKPQTGEKTKKPVFVAQTEVIKTGTTIVEREVDAKGKLSEHWHIKDLRIMKLPDSPTPIVCPDFGGGDIYSVNFAISDFAGLEWISAKTYAGMQKLQGRDCIVFKTSVSPLNARAQQEEAIAIEQAKTFGEPIPEGVQVLATAYIDLATRLPVIAVFGNEKRSYQFGDPPTTTLALPLELAAAVKEYEKRIARLSAPAGKPF